MTNEKATIHFELLLNRKVISVDGRRTIGRIEEAVVERNGNVKEFHIGTSALFERLMATAVSMIGGTRHTSGCAATWEQIDLSDPRRPRLLCDVSELRPLE